MARILTGKEAERQEKVRKFRREEALRKNPLVEHRLGDLVKEMHALYHADNNVILPEDKIPQSSIDNYKKYNSILNELNRRENEYRSAPSSLYHRAF